MGYVKQTALAALAALAVIATPAQAGEVVVVDGGKAKRVQDPAVPSRAEIELGMPVGGREPLGLSASAASTVGARASGATARSILSPRRWPI